MTQTVPARPQGEHRITDPALETARLSTVIASAPGLTEQSLRTTLESLPTVRIVATAAGCLSALQLVRETQAGLVVIDANIPFEETQRFLRLLEHWGRETRSLVLAATTTQVYRALAAGADAALRRDASIRELGAALLELHQTKPGKAHRSTPDHSECP